jgi:hypothetical protein
MQPAQRGPAFIAVAAVAFDQMVHIAASSAGWL